MLIFLEKLCAYLLYCKNYIFTSSFSECYETSLFFFKPTTVCYERLWDFDKLYRKLLLIFSVLLITDELLKLLLNGTFHFHSEIACEYHSKAKKRNRHPVVLICNTWTSPINCIILITANLYILIHSHEWRKINSFFSFRNGPIMM